LKLSLGDYVMKIKVLTTAILLVSTGLALAGHIEHESNEQDEDINAVAEINSSQPEVIQRSATDKNNVDLPKIDKVFIDQYDFDVDAYKDLDF